MIGGWSGGKSQGWSSGGGSDQGWASSGGGGDAGHDSSNYENNDFGSLGWDDK